MAGATLIRVILRLPSPTKAREGTQVRSTNDETFDYYSFRTPITIIPYQTQASGVSCDFSAEVSSVSVFSTGTSSVGTSTGISVA